MLLCGEKSSSPVQPYLSLAAPSPPLPPEEPGEGGSHKTSNHEKVNHIPCRHAGTQQLRHLLQIQTRYRGSRRPLRPRRRESFRLRLQPRQPPLAGGLHRSLPPHADRHCPRAQHRPAYGPPPCERGRSHLALRPTLLSARLLPLSAGNGQQLRRRESLANLLTARQRQLGDRHLRPADERQAACTSCRGAEP